MLVSDYFRHLRSVIDNRIFRYDNTEHFPDLPNFPYHKHTPKNVIASSSPTLEEVLKGITQLKR